MYAGKLMEMAEVVDLFRDPLHPYTQGLLLSIPRIDQDVDKYKKPLKEIPGTVPSLLDLPSGCRFNLRCSYADDQCGKEEPPLELRKLNHWVRCWLE
jgi:oligopeptide/dipeptide ABC transporter ATP-binding protein